MSNLQFIGYTAVVTRENESYKISVYDSTYMSSDVSLPDHPKVFSTIEEVERHVSSCTYDEVIYDTSDSKAFERDDNDQNGLSYSGINLNVPGLDATEEEIQAFSDEANAQNLCVEDGVAADTSVPDPLVTKENPADPELPPSYDDPAFADNSEFHVDPEGPDSDERFDGANPRLVGPPTNSSQKANIDRRGMRLDQRKITENNATYVGGVLNTPNKEAVPEFKKLAGDKVYQGDNNQWIVFTRDRPGNVNTGYGAQGHTQAGAIDMCVGRMSPHPREIDNQGKPVRVGPIFLSEIYADENLEVVDACRIYMSQKTDIDENFGLADGYMGSKTTQSGIGIKADAIRVISRSGGIKLVTHAPSDLNSQGAKNTTEPAGVEIIAGNNDENIQPMVLGDNLRELLVEMCGTIAEINGTVSSLLTTVNKLQYNFTKHTHVNVQSVPTLPSLEALECIPDMIKILAVDKPSTFMHNFNNNTLQGTYLAESNKQSQKSILSKNNRVN